MVFGKRLAKTRRLRQTAFFPGWLPPTLINQFSVLFDGFMRDLALIIHVLLGIAVIVLPVWILLQLKKPGKLVKPVAILAAAAAWILVIPAGILYLLFYPATKTLILAGNWPWAHQIAMETKEHWGLLLPLIATVAASLVVQNKLAESKRWWKLTIFLALAIAVLGRIVSIGGNA